MEPMILNLLGHYRLQLLPLKDDFKLASNFTVQPFLIYYIVPIIFFNKYIKIYPIEPAILRHISLAKWKLQKLHKKTLFFYLVDAFILL